MKYLSAPGVLLHMMVSVDKQEVSKELLKRPLQEQGHDLANFNDIKSLETYA